MPYISDVELNYWDWDESQGGTRPYPDQYVICIEDTSSRPVLEQGLFLLRQGESRGDIESYYRGLCEALNECKHPRPSGEVAVLNGCDEFLVNSFGKVLYYQPTQKLFNELRMRFEELRVSPDWEL